MNRVAETMTPEDKARVAKHFVMTSQLEYLFWEMGYRQQTYEVQVGDFKCAIVLNSIQDRCYSKIKVLEERVAENQRQRALTSLRRHCTGGYFRSSRLPLIL